MTDQVNLLDEKGSSQETSLLEEQGQSNQGATGQGSGSTGDGAAEPKAIKIGDIELSPEELLAVVKKSRDYDSLLPDYTRKTQRLSQLEDQLSNQFSNQHLKAEEPEIDISDYDLDLVKKAGKKLGLVSKNEIQKIKDDMAIGQFKDKHLEYKDPVKWGVFRKELEHYRLPSDSLELTNVFERAHRSLNIDVEIEKKSREAQGKALAEKEKLALASTGGGGGASKVPSSTEGLTPAQIAYMKDFGLLD